METGGGMGLRNSKTRTVGEAPAKASSCNGSGHNGLTVSSFFSGIGGFDLGFQNAGFSVAFQCELNPFCQAILKKHWPKVPKKEDIRTIESGAGIPISDVWAGGLPCQDVSLARMGPRPGLKGKQSGLFRELSRLLEGHCPRVLLTAMEYRGIKHS